MKYLVFVNGYSIYQYVLPYHYVYSLLILVLINYYSINYDNKF